MAASAVHVGFSRYNDVLTDRVTDIGVEAINVAIAEEAMMWNSIADLEFEAFVKMDSTPEFKVKLPGNRNMQPIAVDGNPRPQTVTGSYQVGFPIFGYGDAIGFTRDTKNTMTVQEVKDQVDGILAGDAKNKETRLLRAMLHSDEWTFEDKSRAALPDVTVKPFANDDTVVYTRWGEDAAIDDHYLAQAAAIADETNPYPTIFEELREHPSNFIAQNGQVVTYISSSLVTTTEALTNLVEVKNTLIIPGISSDRVDDAILQWVGFGDRVIGLVDGNIVVEWKSLPAGYMISYAPNATVKICNMRERPEAAMSGLFIEENEGDGNFSETRFLRFFGIGVLNRIGGLAYQIGNATYENLTAFDPRQEK